MLRVMVKWLFMCLATPHNKLPVCVIHTLFVWFFFFNMGITETRSGSRATLKYNDLLIVLFQEISTPPSNRITGNSKVAGVPKSHTFEKKVEGFRLQPKYTSMGGGVWRFSRRTR